MTRRIHGKYEGRCCAVSHDGLVYAVATDPEGARTIEEQTRNALGALEAYLEEAGSGKAGLLQATIYLTDMRNKPAMNAIWCECGSGRRRTGRSGPASVRILNPPTSSKWW